MKLKETPYDSFFEEQEEKYQIPGLANIIKSMAFTESSFDPEAVGELGEKGMMQFRDVTAEQYGVQDPFNPQQAITGAAKKFADDYNYYTDQGFNSLKARNLAIEAYNGGRGNAGKSKQTSIYLDKVLGNLPDVSISSNVRDFYLSPTQTDVAPSSIAPTDVSSTDVDERTQRLLDIINTVPKQDSVKDKKKVEIEPVDVRDQTKVLNQLDSITVAPKQITSVQEEELIQDENYQIILDYLKARYGEDNLQKRFTDRSTRQDVIDMFLSDMRSVEWNTSLGAAPELLFINNIKDRDVLTKIARGHELYESLPDITDEFKSGEYADAFKKLGLGLGNLALDPTSYIGVGVGTFLKYRLARQGIKTILKNKIRDYKTEKGIDPKEKISVATIRKLKKEIEDDVFKKKAIATVAGGALESTVGVGHSIIDQRIDLDLKTQQFKFDLQRRLFDGLITKEEAAEEVRQFKEDNKLDTNLIILNGALGGLLGAGGVAASVYGYMIPKISSIEIYKDYLKKLEISPTMLPSELDDVTKEFSEQILKDFEGKDIDFGTIDFSKIKELRGLSGQELRDTYKRLKQEGKITLDQMQEMGVLTQAQIKNDIAKKSMQAAFRILVSNDYFKPEIMAVIKKERRIKDVLADVLSAADTGKVDSLVLKNALDEAGLTLAEFTNGLRYKYGEAGEALQGLKKLAGALNKMGNNDPLMKNLLDHHFSQDMYVKKMRLFSRGLDFIKRIEREGKALVVSSIATTMRNIYGTGIGLTLDSATRVLDSGIYSVLKSVDATLSGRYKPTNPYLKRQGHTPTDTFAKTIESSFGTLGQLLVNTKLSLNPTDAIVSSQVKIADQFDLLLKNNPYMRNLLLTSLQETGEANLSVVARFANTFNVAADAVNRRAQFVYSIKRQALRMGIDFEELLANNRKIPTNVLQKAADEALEATFGKMPSALKDEGFGATVSKRGVNAGLEEYGNHMARMFVDVFEKYIPGGSLLVPFPRFMANAMAFQYRYSIFQFGKAFGDATEIISLTTRGKKEVTGKIARYKEINKQLEAGEITQAKKAELLEKEDLVGFNPKNEEALLRQFDLKIDQAYQDMSLATSRGLMGTGLLMYAANYRRENQDIEWYYIRTSKGGLIDTRNIFPIAPFLALGDAMAKFMQQDSRTKGGPEEIEVRGIAEALAGIKLAPAPLFPLADEALRMVGERDFVSNDKLQRWLGEVLGDFGSRFIQTGQPIYAFMDLFDAEYGVAKDPAATEATHGTELMFEIAANKFIGRTAGALGKEELEDAVSIFSPEAPVRGTEFFSVLLGFREMPRTVNKVEKEAKKLNVNPYRFFNISGDRKFDRLLIENSHQFTIGNLDYPGLVAKLLTPGTFENDKYKNMSFINKKRTFMKAMANAVQSARQKTVAQFSLKEANRMFKVMFNRMSRVDRRAVVEAYRDRTNKDLSKTQDFKDAFLVDFYNLEVTAIDSGKYDKGLEFDEPIVKEYGVR
mgnify:CR=1 FL=1|tara:strand:+ start:431 stop:4867 length:4437 start_codon:yes stop_codon:yes gene_type:complete